MNLGIVSINTKDVNEIAKYTLGNHLEYANRHNYKMFSMYNFIPTKYMVKGIGFAKIHYLLHLMEQNADIYYFLYVDADLIFTDMTKALETIILGVGQEKDICITNDPHGINCGTFFLRNSEWSKHILRRVLEIGPQPGNWKSISEQGVLDDLIKLPEHSPHCSVVPNKHFNSYAANHSFGTGGVKADMSIKAYVWEPGDFAVHLCGLDNNSKISKSKEYLSKVIR